MYLPESLFDDAILASHVESEVIRFVCYLSDKYLSLKKRRGTRANAQACQRSNLQTWHRGVLLRPADSNVRLRYRGATVSPRLPVTKNSCLYPGICFPSSVNRGVKQIGPLVACGWLYACLHLATSHVLKCTWLQIGPVATHS